MLKYKDFKNIKKNESFNDESDYVWIYGVPSGEAIRITEDTLDDFIDKKIVDFTMKYDIKGDYIFDDKSLNIIKNYLIDNEYITSIKSYNHDFNESLIDKIKIIIKKVSGNKTIFLQDNYMGITFDEYDIYIEVFLSDNSYKMTSKYKISIRKNKSLTDSYNIPNDELLLNRINKEINQL